MLKRTNLLGIKGLRNVNRLPTSPTDYHIRAYRLPFMFNEEFIGTLDRYIQKRARAIPSSGFVVRWYYFSPDRSKLVIVTETLRELESIVDPALKHLCKDIDAAINDQKLRDLIKLVS